MAIFDIDGKISKFDDGSQIAPIYDLSPLKYYFNNSVYSGGLNSYDLFSVAHISDLHNDPVRYRRFLKFVKDNSRFIDICATTGDLVDAPTTTTFAEMNTEETGFSIDLLKTVGNHEKNFGNIAMTNEQIYANWNLTTNTGKTYYYKDYASKKIRIIVLNPYDTEISEADSTFSQAQIDWFIDTLKGAKTNNYAVIILRHNFDGGKSTSNDYGFYQRFFWWDGHFETELNCNGTPIEDIVHAFMTGGAISESYTFKNGAPTITVNTSFSGAGHFIAYLIGHNHADLVGFSPKYADQLYLAVAQGVCFSTYRGGTSGTSTWTTASDLARYGDTKSQDLFNLYSFDTTKKQVKIIRIGASINDQLQRREMAVIPYNGTN